MDETLKLMQSAAEGWTGQLTLNEGYKQPLALDARGTLVAMTVTDWVDTFHECARLRRELAEANRERDAEVVMLDAVAKERDRIAAYAVALKAALLRFDRTCRVFDQTPTNGCECVGCIATRALAAEGVAFDPMADRPPFPDAR